MQLLFVVKHILSTDIQKLLQLQLFLPSLQTCNIISRRDVLVLFASELQTYRMQHSFQMVHMHMSLPSWIEAGLREPMTMSKTKQNRMALSNSFVKVICKRNDCKFTKTLSIKRRKIQGFNCLNINVILYSAQNKPCLLCKNPIQLVFHPEKHLLNS